MKRVALYDPYLNILGGGERYVLSILHVFESRGYACSIFWNSDVSKEIYKKLGIRFHGLDFIPHVFPSSTLQTLWTLKTFDYFIYVTDGSYFFSTAKKNYIYAMVPQKSLYTRSFLNRLKTLNYTFITHSEFTKNHLKNWEVDSKLLYPYVDAPHTISFSKKEKMILTVGRFFKHLHSKRQDLAILAFKRLRKNPEFADFRLVLAGGLEKDDEDYYRELKRLANNDSSIVFRPNISFDELDKLYKLSTFYWHFAGSGVDEDTHPESVEHMGIAPIEAMAYGSIPFCYKGGGPKEIINQETNGFLFTGESELIRQMTALEKNQQKIQSIQKEAIGFVRKKFGYSQFERQVIKLFEL